MAERVVVMVDGGNMNAGRHARDLIVRWPGVLRFAQQGGPRRGGKKVKHTRAIVGATLYAGPPGRLGRMEREKWDNFVHRVEAAGFDVRLCCEEGAPSKTSVDRDIIMDAMTLGYNHHIDVLVLLSGDGGFTRLVEVMKVLGVRVEVMAFADTSQALQKAASLFVDICDRKAVGEQLVGLATGYREPLAPASDGEPEGEAGESGPGETGPVAPASDDEPKA